LAFTLNGGLPSAHPGNALGFLLVDNWMHFPMKLRVHGACGDLYRPQGHRPLVFLAADEFEKYSS
jgi:hypothetical protein